MNGNRMRGRILAVGGVLALVLGACGGSATATSPAASTAAGASTGAGAASQAPAASTAPAGGTDPIGALSDLTSYKIKITMASKGVTGGLAQMGNLSMEGTVLAKPDKAADVTMSLGAIKMHIIEVGGKSYNDISGTMTEGTDPSSTSLADSFSPDKLFGGFSRYISQMKTVGDEQKNGVAATHLQADASTLTDAASALALLGIANGTWSWDLWIAKDGGYAVSYVLSGTGADSSNFSMSMDLSDVNSASNKVTAP